LKIEELLVYCLARLNPKIQKSGTELMIPAHLQAEERLASAQRREFDCADLLGPMEALSAADPPSPRRKEDLKTKAPPATSSVMVPQEVRWGGGGICLSAVVPRRSAGVVGGSVCLSWCCRRSAGVVGGSVCLSVCRGAGGLPGVGFSFCRLVGLSP
jgi:hypothetical protein